MRAMWDGKRCSWWDLWKCCGGHLGFREEEEGQADGHDGSVEERCRYQSQAALLISSRSRCLLTLNDTLVGPMASLRWQHGRPALLKCKSGFNLKQSRLAEIIFLPSSQVLPSLLSFFIPPPLTSHISLYSPSLPPPCSSTTLTPGVQEMERASLEETTDKGKGGGGRERKRGRRKGAAVLTPAFCPDEGAEERHRQAQGWRRLKDKTTWERGWNMGRGGSKCITLPGMTTHKPPPSVWLPHTVEGDGNSTSKLSKTSGEKKSGNPFHKKSHLKSVQYACRGTSWPMV